jgi:hypothetical protein
MHLEYCAWTQTHATHAQRGKGLLQRDHLDFSEFFNETAFKTHRPKQRSYKYLKREVLKAVKMSMVLFWVLTFRRNVI